MTIEQEVVYRVALTRDGAPCVQVRDGNGLADGLFVKRQTVRRFSTVDEAVAWARQEAADSDGKRVCVPDYVGGDES